MKNAYITVKSYSQTGHENIEKGKILSINGAQYKFYNRKQEFEMTVDISSHIFHEVSINGNVLTRAERGMPERKLRNNK